MKFRRVEVPSLGYHMVYPRLPHPPHELEGTISRSNLTSTEMKKKYLESLQINISNSYCKRGKHHLHLQSAQFI